MNSEYPRLNGHQIAPLAASGEASRYVAMVAHELRGPLLPIINAASLLARAPDEVNLVRRSAAVIERQARIIGLLIEDLMNLSATQMGPLRLRRAPLALSELLKRSLETIAPFAAQYGVRVVVNGAHDPISLCADSLRLGQALQNVLFNAVKYSKPHGEIRLRAEQDGDDVLISVSDDGIGIAAADLETIFALFKQGSPGHSGGLGIGLYLARQMVEAHGGKITATSGGPGVGSTFSIRVPRSNGADYAAGFNVDGASSRSDSLFTTS